MWQALEPLSPPPVMQIFSLEILTLERFSSVDPRKAPGANMKYICHRIFFLLPATGMFVNATALIQSHKIVKETAQGK